METLQTWARALLDFAYPPHCAVCEADIEAAALLCGSCWAEIVPRHPRPRADDGGRAFEKIVALGPFTDALQQAIYALKFRNQVRLGRALGERMGQCLAEQLAPLDCLLPACTLLGSGSADSIRARKSPPGWAPCSACPCATG